MMVHLSTTNEWVSFASFVVEFQTRTLTGELQEQQTKVHLIETDTCAHWPGIEKERLCQWILDRAQERLAALAKEKEQEEVG
ncbi:MAG: hypothetical protein DCC55_27390 [Chloroflexi bacterium]|nr:MAG: hypothetical protein DCC55_27390 [Chloroflexota bacterium]